MNDIIWSDVKINKNGTETPLPTFDNFLNLMDNSSKFQICFDLISKRIVPPKSITENYSLSAQPQALLDACRDSLERNGIRADYKRVSSWVTACADLHRINPVTEYFKGLLPAFEPVETRRLFQCLKITESSELHFEIFRKWLVQAVAMAHNTGECGADFVLVLQGAQGCGKTSFFRALCRPDALRPYFKEGASLSADNKDSVIETTRSWICELGELERTTRKEAGWLKAFLTAPIDEYRAPYGASSVQYPRNTVFCATVNDETFLREAGRRFYTIQVEDVDLEALKAIDIDHVWAESYEQYIEDRDFFRLEKAAISQIIKKSEKFALPTDEETVLRDCLDFEDPEALWKWLTATEIAQVAGLRSPVKVGKALVSMGYSKNSADKPIKQVHNTSKYFVPPIKNSREEYAALNC